MSTPRLPEGSRESLSQFLARALDQMSVSAWLPSLAAVAGALALGQLAANDGSVAEALADIGGFGFAEIVLLVLAVVVVTMFSQAFEFAAVRVLEGYWPAHGPAGRVTAWRRRHHRGVRDNLEKGKDNARAAAAESCKAKVREKHGEVVFVAMKTYLLNVGDQDKFTAEVLFEAEKLADMWEELADPEVYQRYEVLEQRLEEYPEVPHRILPTRLGNIP